VRSIDAAAADESDTRNFLALYPTRVDSTPPSSMTMARKCGAESRAARTGDGFQKLT